MTVTRRAAMAGVAVAILIARPAVATETALKLLRVGVVAGLGLDEARLGAVTRMRWGWAAVPVSFPAWGCLVDHAAAAGPGLIDAAVLPAAAAEPPLATTPGLAAVLMRRAFPPRRIGVALPPPGGAIALRRLVDAPDGTLVVLPPAMLVPNLAAGAIDAALVVGDDATAPRETPPGVTVVRLGPAVADTLLPRLTLRLCPAARFERALTG